MLVVAVGDWLDIKGLTIYWASLLINYMCISRTQNSSLSGPSMADCYYEYCEGVITQASVMGPAL